MNANTAEVKRRDRFDRVVGVFHQDMYRYAAWLCRDPGIAEEVVQEALLRAWKSLDALRTTRPPNPGCSRSSGGKTRGISNGSDWKPSTSTT